MNIKYEADLSIVFNSVIGCCFTYNYTPTTITPTAKAFIYEYSFY